MWNLHGSVEENESLSTADRKIFEPKGPKYSDRERFELTPASVVLDSRDLKTAHVYDGFMESWDSCPVRNLADSLISEKRSVDVYVSKEAFWKNPDKGKRFSPADFMGFVKAMKRY